MASVQMSHETSACVLQTQKHQVRCYDPCAAGYDSTTSNGNILQTSSQNEGEWIKAMIMQMTMIKNIYFNSFLYRPTHTHTFTHLHTYSTKQSPSWEATWVLS